MNAKYKSKDLLLAITSMKNKCRELLKTNPPYAKILKVILESDFDFYDDENNAKLPTMGELKEKCGVSLKTLGKEIKNIYFDLIGDDLEAPTVINHSKQEVVFYLSGYSDDRSAFRTELSTIPNKGEYVDISYFRPILGASTFYVDTIGHEFQDGKHIVILTLKVGIFNSYMVLRRDQAIATESLKWKDYILSDDDLVEKLNLRLQPW